MTRYARLMMATAMLAILAMPAYAEGTAVSAPVAPVPPTVPAVKALETSVKKDAVIETATGAVDAKLIPSTEIKSVTDTVLKPEDIKKNEAMQKSATGEKTETKHEVKPELKSHDLMKKDDKKLEHAVPETGKN